ncbi:Cyanovirin-N [Naviculisporaceae sp. PSN 640]
MQFSSAVIMAVAAIAPSVFGTPVATPEAAIVDSTGSVEPVAAENPLAKRSFYDTCQDCYWKGMASSWTMECRCRNKSGDWPWTSINLNNCLANANGQLVWRRNGGAGGSCIAGDMGYRNSVGGWWVWATCAPLKYDSSINLNERIHNQNGVLACDV